MRGYLANCISYAYMASIYRNSISVCHTVSPPTQEMYLSQPYMYAYNYIWWYSNVNDLATCIATCGFYVQCMLPSWLL